MASSTLPPTRSVIRNVVRHYSAPVDSSIPASKIKYIPTSGTYPKGFKVSGTHVGVKPANKSRPDLALIASDRPAFGAAVFTTNKFQAAPVQVSRSVLEKRGGTGLRSIIINSGCANAVTGVGGMEDARAMSETASSQFQDSMTPASDPLGSNSLVMSTGVIGQRLPTKKILSKIPTAYSNLDDSHHAWLTAAKAICTTDTFPKLLSTTFTLPSTQHQGIEYRLAGMTKGAGMIHPNMATLLGILCTDAPIGAAALQSLLTGAVNRSFNSISIDGDTSTNDTVAILANGAASPSASTPPIANDPSSPDYRAMSSVLTSFAQRLSQLVVRDGEGATKFVQVTVRNAPTYNDAKEIASTIARSPLVKTALYGKDANWGRILCAIGYTPHLSAETVAPNRTNVSFVPAPSSKSADEGVLKLLVNGEPQAVDEVRAARLLEDEDLEIDVDLGTGSEEARYWFCDFSHEYVTINGDYRT
ncbi:glutamate N-acetyltransferase/amino-acid acetyltransferase [Rhinocladiella mackenziei CBS 650.93]|uniref:Arginine biosynthesis bifunctional protein ArgJ, mitochondrial n=1 Tax=Rhinocladiella mackenziei CBS 650.93 TaxID=1442369 RepID=A0A0D2G4P8_9EURO|nr:glutamate N-acetyltransferase/amino-acid acetyltransferase [Rhinocladiella mackenziei CBS 650.93]KIX09692.1 glutamate N-acetyltransferase/amino-acid acetyltransferase [Rhinocladiella mackenziei CBS 650.93]